MNMDGKILVSTKKYEERRKQGMKEKTTM